MDSVPISQTMSIMRRGELIGCKVARQPPLRQPIATFGRNKTIQPNIAEGALLQNVTELIFLIDATCVEVCPGKMAAQTTVF